MKRVRSIYKPRRLQTILENLTRERRCSNIYPHVQIVAYVVVHSGRRIPVVCEKTFVRYERGTLVPDLGRRPTGMGHLPITYLLCGFDRDLGSCVHRGLDSRPGQPSVATVDSSSSTGSSWIKRTSSRGHERSPLLHCIQECPRLCLSWAYSADFRIRGLYHMISANTGLDGRTLIPKEMEQSGASDDALLGLSR